MSKMKDYLIDQIDAMEAEQLQQLETLQNGGFIDSGVGVTISGTAASEHKSTDAQRQSVAEAAQTIMIEHEAVLRKLQDSSDAQRLEMLLEVLRKHEPAIVDLAQQAYNSPYTNLSVHKAFVWSIEALINRLRLEQIG